MSESAKKIGKVLAFLQVTVDFVLLYGFHKLKKASSSTKGKQSEAGKAARKALNYVGEVGESYYLEYERLKQKR